MHGTMMASIIAHGDLNADELPLPSPIYIRPILRPNFATQGAAETIPDNVLPIDLVYRAVKRIAEGEDGAPAAAPRVRIVNLSVGDPHRHFDQSISPWARLLDWLAWRYDLLFIVSAGNHSDDVTLPWTRRDHESKDASEISTEILRCLAERARHRRLLSPAGALPPVGSCSQYSHWAWAYHFCCSPPAPAGWNSA